MNTPSSHDTGVYRRLVSHFVPLCVLVALFLLCIAIVLMTHEAGSYMLWARLSGTSALVAFLGISLSHTANSLDPQPLGEVAKRALSWALIPLVGAVISFYLGGAWRPIVTLLGGIAVSVFILLVTIELWLSNLLRRLEREP